MQKSQVSIALTATPSNSINMRKASPHCDDSSIVEARILQYEAQALSEECEGCFGLAEIFWKYAFTLSDTHFPTDKLTARIARGLGEFLRRVLPISEQSARYLKMCVSVENSIDRDSADTVAACLQLSKSLIGTDDCDEANSLLQSLLSRKGETALRALTYLGRIRLVRHDVLKAEEILRQNARDVKNQFPSSHLLAETLTLLAETLCEKEEYTECRSLLQESLAILSDSFCEDYFTALRLMGKLLRETHQCSELESFFASELLRLRKRQASSYVLAAVLTVWGDSYGTAGGANATQRYLQALDLYCAVRSVSWFAARTLSKLVEVTVDADGREWLSSVNQKASELLSEQLSELQATSTMMSLPNIIANTQSDFISKLMFLVQQNSDELVSGEALNVLKFITDESYKKDIRDHISQYIEAYPQSKQTAFLHQYPREMLNSALALMKTLRMSPFSVIRVSNRLVAWKQKYLRAISVEDSSKHMLTKGRILCYNVGGWEEKTLREAVQLSREAAPDSFATAKQLLVLARFYENTRSIESAEACYTEAVQMCSYVNPHSSKAATALQDFSEFLLRSNRLDEAHSCVQRAADIRLRSFKLSLYGIKQIYSCLTKVEPSAAGLAFVSALFDRVKDAAWGDQYLFLTSFESLAKDTATEHFCQKVLLHYSETYSNTGYMSAIKRLVGRDVEDGGLPTLRMVVFRWLEKIYRAQQRYGKAEEMQMQGVVPFVRKKGSRGVAYSHVEMYYREKYSNSESSDSDN